FTPGLVRGVNPQAPFLGLSLMPSGETSAKESRQSLLKESVGKSRRDAMFIEKPEPIDFGEPIYGRTIVGCAPKGAPTSRLCLPFYRHFTATRLFSRQTPEGGLEIYGLGLPGVNAWAREKRFSPACL